MGVNANDVKRTEKGLRLAKIPEKGAALKKSQVGLISEARWPYGKGTVVFRGDGIASSLDGNGKLNLVFQTPRQVKTVEFDLPEDGLPQAGHCNWPVGCLDYYSDGLPQAGR